MGKEPKDKEIRRRYKTNDGHRNIKHTVKDKKKKKRRGERKECNRQQRRTIVYVGWWGKRRGRDIVKQLKRSRQSESRSHSMPESFNAFCRIVSFTAANTNRMFPVSVACVRLEDDERLDWLVTCGRDLKIKEDVWYRYSLRINTQPSTICLHKSPQDVLCRFVDVRTASVFGKVALEGNLW